MKVYMIFTEGPHDVSFIRNVLKFCCNATEKTKIKLDEFPEPLSSIFKEYIKNRYMQDLSLDMVQKFFLPDRVFEKNDFFIMLFYTGGKDNVAQVKSFISDLEFNIKHKPDINSRISDHNYIFINDADEQLFENVVNDIKKRYFPIVDTDTNETYLTENDGFYYVWHGTDGKGTLEDILIKLLETSNADLLSKSESFVKESFDYLRNPSDIPTQAKQYKAILTSAGQGKSAGGSLNSILIKGKLITEDAFKGSEAVKDFANFLNQIL